MAKPTPNEQIEKTTRKAESLNYDGRITEVFDEYAHVRMAGSNTIKRNVLIASHIDKELLKPGVFVKLSDVHARTGDRLGKMFVMAVLCQVEFADTEGGGDILPSPPQNITAVANCALGQWEISWDISLDALFYELYWATNSDGNSAVLLTATTFSFYDVPFDTQDPPKVYFAVKAKNGVSESNLTRWVTDEAYLTAVPIISFGDEYHHGHVDANIRWRVTDGLVEMSENFGASWSDITPTTSPPDSFGDGAPGPGALVYTQVFGNADDLYVLASYQTGGSQERGWFANSVNLGSSWTWYALNSLTPSQLRPIWADFNDTHLLISTWEDDKLYIQQWDYVALTYTAHFDFGDCTISELDNRTLYLFPKVVSDNDAVWYAAGRFENLPGA